MIIRKKLKYDSDKKLFTILDSYKKTPLHYAASNPAISSDIIEELVKYIPELINYQDSLKRTPLHLYCLNKSLDIKAIQIFLDNDFNVELCDTYLRTALHLVCKNENVTLDIVKLDKHFIYYLLVYSFNS